MRNRTPSPTLLIFTLAFVLAVSLSPAAAQDAQESTAVDELSREEVETLAAAFLEVSAIQYELQSRLEQAATPEEAQSLQRLANDQVLAALEEHGVSAEEYTAAMNATQDNVEFRDRFMDAVDRIQSEGPEDDGDEG